MKRIICLFLCLFALAPSVSFSIEEADVEGRTVTVLAKLLNGRMNPSKGAMKVAFFDQGDVLEMTGRWSDDHEWVEVIGGEAGCCWVSRMYVTERTDAFMVKNRDYSKVKIRKKPSDKSKVSGYLRKGKSVEITQVIYGWGKCKLGWIDLYYVEEED